MARNRKRPSSVQSFKDDFANTGLPTPEEVEQAAVQLTKEEKKAPLIEKKAKPRVQKAKAIAKPKTSKQRFTLADASDPAQEEINEKGRARFNTTIRPELRELLHKIAKNNRLTVSDVLEEVLIDYFGLKK